MIQSEQNLELRLKVKDQLRLLLKQHGITASELARRSGVPKQVLSQWLGGVEPRKLTHLKKVADVFGISIDALCFGNSRKESLQSNHSFSPNWIEGVFEGRIRIATITAQDGHKKLPDSN